MLPDSDKLSPSVNKENSELTFHPFLRLPPELRVMVWENIIPKQRVVRIRDAKIPDPEAEVVIPAPWNLPAVDLKVVHEVPAILQVNIESRKEGLKLYTSPFYSRLKDPILFNFSRDILVFDGHSPSIDFLSFFHFWFERSHYGLNPERIEEWRTIQAKLRHLIIANSPKARSRDWIFFVLAGFSQLKLLGSPSWNGSYMPRLPNWPVSQVRYPPPGPMWRILHRHWANVKTGKGTDFSTLSKPEVKQHWGALVRGDAQYMRDIWRNPFTRASLGVHCLEDLMNEKISKSKTPWLTDTDIYFFEDDELQDFLLELETKLE